MFLILVILAQMNEGISAWFHRLIRVFVICIAMIMYAVFSIDILKALPKGSMYNVKSNGASTEPCGTP